MADIYIKGDNNGIAVGGDLNIKELVFERGKGVKYASGIIEGTIEDAEIVPPAESDEPIPQQPKSKRGAPLAKLFVDDSYIEIEKNRVVNFLKKHGLQELHLDSSKENELNIIIVGFIHQWITRNLVPERPRYSAIFRFLTQECGLRSDVQHDAFETHISQWIAQADFVDLNTQNKVEKSFSEA